MTPHVLVTALGLYAKEARYSLDGHEAAAVLAPLALLELLEASGRPMPDRVLALVTAGALDKTLGILRDGLSKYPVEIQEVRVPDGASPEEVREIVETIGTEIPAGASLTLDVTHGFRHFPFLFFAAANYLVSLRGVSISGVWYGMIEGRSPAPWIDLSILLELPRWQAAVLDLTQEGRTGKLAREFEAMGVGLRERERRSRGNLRLNSKAMSALATHLKKASVAYECALPLEYGRSAGEALTLLPRAREDWAVPFGAELAAAIDEGLDPVGRRGLKHRRDIGDLDASELDRQSLLIDRYIAAKMFAQATRAIREWIVSRVLFSLGANSFEAWLGHSGSGRRREVEDALGRLARAAHHGSADLEPAQRGMADFWLMVTSYRNPLAHCGMTVDPGSVGSRGDWIEVEQMFGRLLTGWDEWKVRDFPALGFGGGQGRILVLPLGLSPGLLFTCLKQVECSQVLLVVTESSQGLVDSALEALESEGRARAEVRFLKVPIAASEAARQLTAGGFLEDHRDWLQEADEVVACMTGGTSLMGLFVAAIADDVQQRLGRPTRRFVAVDERPYQEQRDAPWVAGELVWIDPETCPMEAQV